jgi:integrase
MNMDELTRDILILLSQYGIIIPNMNEIREAQGPKNQKILEKKHGFKLTKVESDDVHYEVRYKDGPVWLNTRNIVYAQNNDEALMYAIREKDRIISEYKERKEKRLKAKNEIQLYVLLSDYYLDNSPYLEKDRADNRKSLIHRRIIEARNSIKKIIIPYLKENKIKSLNEITREVYANLKVFLLGKNFTARYINNILAYFNRILIHCERYEYIPKLPYSKGQGIVTIPKDEKNKHKGDCLPVEKLFLLIKLCFYLAETNNYKKPIFSLENVLLFAMGLTLGLRDKETVNLRVKDIKYCAKEKMYLAYIGNNKIKDYTTEIDEYRKIPIHNFIAQKIENYVLKTGKKQDDLLFSNSGKSEIEASHRKIVNAIILPFIALERSKSITIENVKNLQFLSTEYIDGIKKYMQEKNYHFYSFRHTISTIMGLEKLNPDFNDYIMGHKKPGMKQNYTHINSVENSIFCQEYGKSYLQLIEKYFFPKPRDERIKDKEKAFKDFVENLDKKPENSKGVFEII